MSLRFSTPNVPASFSVSEETLGMFVHMWAAWEGDTLLGYFDSRTLAEHACMWHFSEQQCLEEA